MDTPFSEYKATELTQVRLYDYFVEPRYISKMYSNDVVFIIGQRGTGKTTLLKYLCETYNTGNNGAYERLGIYYRFDINKMHSYNLCRKLFHQPPFLHFSASINFLHNSKD